MWANLVLTNAPGGQLRLVAELTPGPLGDALYSALEQAYLADRVPGLVRISQVIFRGIDLVTNLDVYDYFLIVDQERVFTPTLELRCTWRSEAGEELLSADQAVDSEFSDAPLAEPVQHCREDLAGSSATSQRPEPEPLLPVPATELKPEKLRIYFSSALVEGFNNGDADYIASVVRALRTLGIEATRLVSDFQLPENQGAAIDAGELLPLNYGIVGGDDRTTMLTKGWQATLQHLLADKEQDPELVQILHLQTRYPASGNAYDKTAIETIRASGIHVVVTVHEFLYNLRNPDDPINNVFILDHYCQAAEEVIFLNRDDLAGALENCRSGNVRRAPRFGGDIVGTVTCPDFSDRAHHIPVAITVPAAQISVQEVASRAANVILFGMIRAGKGDKAAIDLAKLFKADPQNTSRVLIAGIPSDESTIKGLMKVAYSEHCMKTLYGKHWNTADIFRGAVRNRDWQTVRDEVGRCAAFREEMLQDYRRNMEVFEENRAENQAAYDQTLQELESLRATVDSQLEGMSDKEIRNRKRQRSPEEEALRARQIELGKLQKLATEPEFPCLPIDIFIDVPAAELIDLFRICKYAYKEDEKGMADNASSIISCIANGCITFTSAGVVTPHEFKRDTKIMSLEQFALKIPKGLDFESAVVFEDRETMISFDYTGVLHDAVVMPEGGESATPEFVFQEIQRRETDGGESNRQTVLAMAQIAEHRFLPEVIAQEHLKLYYQFLLQRYAAQQ